MVDAALPLAPPELARRAARTWRAAAAARNENDREIEKWIFEISESVFIRIRFISF